MFSFLCAGVYALTAYGHAAAVGLQIVLSSLIPVVVFRAGEAFGLSRPLATAAGGLSTIHPGLIIYAVRKLHPLTLDALLIGLLFWLCLGLPNGRAAKWWLTGAVFGLTILSRPTIALFGLVVVSWLRANRGAIMPGAWCWRVAMFVITALFVLLPWTVRNYAVHERIIFVTTDTAELFWRGNNPHATGTAYLLDMRPVLEGAPEEFRRAILASDELGRFDLFLGEALEFVKTRPGEFLLLVFKKWLSFWWFTSTAGGLYPDRWLLAYTVVYVPFLLLVLVGLLAHARSTRHVRSGIALLLGLFVSVSVAQSLFYVEGRHRWGVEPLMAIVAAHGLSLLVNVIRQKGTVGVRS